MESEKVVNDKLKLNDMAKLCQKYAERWTIQDWEFAIVVMTEVMRDVLMERKSFTLRNFATFTTVVGDKSGNRIGRNPKKPDEDIVIKKRVRPRIIWSKPFKNEFKL